MLNDLLVEYIANIPRKNYFGILPMIKMQYKQPQDNHHVLNQKNSLPFILKIDKYHASRITSSSLFNLSVGRQPFT